MGKQKMKNFDPKQKMKNALIGFLEREENSQSQLKMRIMEINPLYVSDDNQNRLEITDWNKEKIIQKLQQEIPDYENKMCLLILKKWKFLLKKINNRDKYYFDLKIEKFDVCEISGYAGE